MIINKGLLLVLIFFVLGCANIVPPDGGEKDVTAPLLVRIHPTDSSTNSQPSKIVFYFNEYVQVDNGSSDVTISPLLTQKPTITAKNKMVVVTLADSLLKPNTTYTLQISNAVKDYTEGNVSAPISYMFSTGDYFDSLNLSGKALNAHTGLSDTGKIQVYLFEATVNTDSLAYIKPLYVTTVNDVGQFVFKGLPKQTFTILVMKDINANYQYDGDDEMIGFLPYTVASTDSIHFEHVVYYFSEEPDSGALRKSTTETSKTKGSKLAMKGDPFLVEVDTSNQQMRRFDIKQGLTIKNLDTSKNFDWEKLALERRIDTVWSDVLFQLDSTEWRERRVKVMSEWQEDQLYRLVLKRGFVADSTTPSEWRQYVFRTMKSSDYAQLEVMLADSFVNQDYVLQVKKGDTLMGNWPILDTIVTTTTFLPGTYQLSIFKDWNKDGKWTTGDFKTKRLPEPVIPFPQSETLKPGWTHRIEFISKEKPVMKP